MAELSTVLAAKQTLTKSCLPACLPAFFPFVSFSLLSIDLGPKYLPLGKYVKDMKRNKFKILKKKIRVIPLQSPVIKIVLIVSEFEISSISQNNTHQNT